MELRNRVVLVGRMNVGKSSLFNRILKKERSIAYNLEGVTRDYLEEIVSWQGTNFPLVDCGGISNKPLQDPLLEAGRKRSLEQLAQAGVVLFVVDGATGLVDEERDLARMVHKAGKPTILVINKADRKVAYENRFEFDALGFKKVVMVSAEHGTGIDELLDAVLEILPEGPLVKAETGLRIAIIGKPNVGKSSLMNLLVKQERSIVSPIEGTTREPIWQPIALQEQLMTLIDTAGIRRQRSVEKGLEELMVQSSFDAMRAAHVVLLVVDGSEGKIADQELKLAFYAFERLGRAVIILFNKSDQTDDYALDRLEYDKEEYQFFLKKIQMLSISCKTGKNVGRIMPLVQEVWDRYNLQIDKDRLTELFKRALLERPLFKSQHRLVVHSAQQVRRAPMNIDLKVNNKLWFERNHLVFLENVLRDAFELRSTPVFFAVENPE